MFRHSRQGVLKIGPEALATMRSFEQHAADAFEAGGLLLGRYLSDAHDLVVDFVSTPMPDDERSRFGFFRGAKSHQRVIDAAWESSGGTCCFLGDWHTHAEPAPTPSPMDVENWQKMLREAIEPDQACFFVIVGQQVIRVWEGDHQTGRITPCPAIEKGLQLA